MARSSGLRSSRPAPLDAGSSRGAISPASGRTAGSVEVAAGVGCEDEETEGEEVAGSGDEGGDESAGSGEEVTGSGGEEAGSGEEEAGGGEEEA